MITLVVKNVFNSASPQVILEEMRKGWVNTVSSAFIASYLSKQRVALKAENTSIKQEVNSGKWYFTRSTGTDVVEHFPQ